MSDFWPESGLHRTRIPHPSGDETLGASMLVYVGRKDGAPFVVRPHLNEKNRWFWREPVRFLEGNADASWGRTLLRLPDEGFYTLPEALSFSGGGRWLENAIVQLGYDLAGRGILFIAERRDSWDQNALFFSERGQRIQDDLLQRLRWAPILPVTDAPGGPLMH